MSRQVFIDIGHGSDTYQRTGGKGVKVDGQVYEEHDFNSRVGTELKKLLESNGITVHYSQPPFSKEVPLRTRTNEANRLEADLFWSIHANAGPSAASGVCSFYWHTSTGGKKLAELFSIEMKKAGFKTHGKGTHASIPGTWTNFHVIRETSMVSVLTENGFMTNPEDFELIFKSKDYPNEVAKVHAQTICSYFGIRFKEPKYVLYRVRRSWSDVFNQIGAYSNLDNAKAMADKHRNDGYQVFNEEGKIVYTPPSYPVITPCENEVEELKDEINRLKELSRDLQEDRDRYKQALIDANDRIKEEL